MVWFLGLASGVGLLGVLRFWRTDNLSGPLALWVLAVALVTGPAAIGNAIRIGRLTRDDSKLRTESGVAILLTIAFYVVLVAYLPRI